MIQPVRIKAGDRGCQRYRMSTRADSRTTAYRSVQPRQERGGEGEVWMKIVGEGGRQRAVITVGVGLRREL